MHLSLQSSIIVKHNATATSQLITSVIINKSNRFPLTQIIFLIHDQTITVLWTQIINSKSDIYTQSKHNVMLAFLKTDYLLYFYGF